MVVVIAMVVSTFPVMFALVLVVMVMVVIVVMVMAVVIVVDMAVVVACAQTKKNKRLVSLDLHLYFCISNLPSFGCSSFKVPIDEFMTETACICQAGDLQNYDI